MSENKRREVRIAGSIDISVALRERVSGQILAGPVPGIINNISTRGVGISLNVIRLEKFHFFYSVLDSLELEICMTVFVPEKEDVKLIIPLRPIWFDRDLANARWPFVMGLEFFSGPEDEEVQVLLKLLRSRRNESDKQQQGLLSRIKKWFRKLAIHLITM